MPKSVLWMLTAALLIAGCVTPPTEESSPIATSGDPRPVKTQTESVKTAPITDLWERIRQGYAIPGHDNVRVSAQFDEYAGLGDYWLRVSERAKPYLYHIVEEIDSRGLPHELALLPIVESAFRPFAYSHGRAAGIWQFIPATGRHYGLEQNWWYDGRRDVLAATDAALNYLTYLNEMFDGDWLLALAAYNAGEGTVMRAVKRNKKAGQATDYWSLKLPRETMNYVPRLLAISELIRDPARHGIELAKINNEPALAVIELDHQVDLALAAELAAIDIETLYALNPGFNRWATAPDGPHRLLLPINQADAFEARLRETPQETWMRWDRHQIAAGETLGEIATRYHVTVDSLQQANNLNTHIIRAGEHLLVPVASRPSEQYTLNAAARAQATRNLPQKEGQRREHIVQSGESFWVIAQRYGVSVEDLAGWNGMAPDDTLAVGEQLVVWNNQAALGSQQNRRANRVTSPSERLQTVTYTVRAGDSLYQIGQRFSVTIQDLQRWNNLTANTYLQPGQRLRMQVDVTAQNQL